LSNWKMYPKLHRPGKRQSKVPDADHGLISNVDLLAND